MATKKAPKQSKNGIQSMSAHRKAFEELTKHRLETFKGAPVPDDAVEDIREAREERAAQIEGRA